MMADDAEMLSKIFFYACFWCLPSTNIGILIYHMRLIQERSLQHVGDSLCEHDMEILSCNPENDIDY